MSIVAKKREFSKSEVELAKEALIAALAAGLPAGSFAEREAAGLELLSAAHREFTERELQAISNGFGDEVVVGGKVYRRHQGGSGQYYAL